MPEIIVIPPTKTADGEIKKIRTAAYARVSSDSDEQQNSFLTQMDYYTQYIKDNPTMEFVDLYADEAVTGTKIDKRDEFKRMLEDCRQGRIDCIITKSVSRFARNTFDCISTVRELKSMGINIIFEENGIDTRRLTGESELIALCSIAQEESISISKNVTISVRHRMKNGTYKQGTSPYGYKVTNGEFVILDEQAEIVKLIFTAYKEGKSLAKIAGELTEMKVKKNDGTYNWNPQRVKYILTNPRYKGDALLQKSFTTEFPYKSRKNRGELDMYYIRNDNPPIVSAELFDTVNKLLKQQANRYCNNTETREYPLSKMIFCSECGCLYRRKLGTIHTYWVCREHDINSDRCKNLQINEAKVYEAFVQMYNRLVKNKEYILGQMLENLMAVKQHRLNQKTEVHDITTQIANLTEQILVINRLKSRGYMESALYVEKITQINSDIIRLKKQK
ncbi:MAG: recombinase family protein, partial [Methanocorpusculum sp.]|nr:recombinase family protein [Methanocorpusculum sp.]